MKRALVIVNKWWECDPVMNVLLNDNARPAKVLGWPNPLNQPHRQPSAPLALNPNPVPRAVFTLKNVTAEIWCISDLLEDLPNNGQFQSSSQRKIERLPEIFKGAAPDLVLAVGTAGLPSDVTENGSVMIGTHVFMHDCYPNGTNASSQWNNGPFEKLLDSSLTVEKFGAFTNLPPTVSSLLLIAPLNPAWSGRILSNFDNVALGAVNVTDYTKYDQTDQATIDAYSRHHLMRNAKSLETTHGLIRSQSNAPFMFVSGITDRVGSFHYEVDPRSYAQNTVAAHNAGIAVSWMLPNIDANL
jgi:hypothetical protein